MTDLNPIFETVVIIAVIIWFVVSIAGIILSIREMK